MTPVLLMASGASDARRESIDKYLYNGHISVRKGEAAMAHVSYSDLRNNLASYMEEVCDSRAPLLVTRQNARSVVIMSEDDYEGLMETVHLLKSPANAARLLRSIKDADRGKLKKREIAEPAKG
jgi:antitoxin YefM